jgi:predicted MFS family arabinose efflux permease
MTAPRRAAWRSGPLANRNFRLLTAGQFTSTVGDFCYAVALPWLVLSERGGAALLGTVLACYGVPRTAGIPLGGVLADKAGPRAVMLAADVVRCGLVAVLAVLATRHIATLPALAPVAALLGLGEGLFLPASFAIMPGVLDPAELQAGNALNSATVQLGTLLGPVLGGVLVASAGSAPAFAADAASFAVSALTLGLLVSRARSLPAGTAAVPDAPDSGDEAAASPDSVWWLLRHSRLLQVLIVVTVVANLTMGGTFEVALPTLAHLKFGAAGYGAIVACFGGGAVIGTLAATKAGGLRRPAPVACAAFLLGAVFTCLVPFLGGLPGAAAATLLMGAGNGFGNIIMITLLQLWAPPALLGRVMSVVMLASMGTFPVSAALAGLLVRVFGPVPFFPVAGAVLAVAILGALTQREARDFGAPGTADAAEPPEPAIRAGPAVPSEPTAEHA